MAKHKYIETPAKLWEYFLAYKREVKAIPFKIKDWVGKDGFEVEREKEKPLTMEGFENYVFELGIANDLSHYFSNYENRYEDFVAICRAIKKLIRDDQITGGMAGIYNPSITQRLNGLSDKVDNRLVDGEGNDRSFDITLNLK